MPMPQKNSVFLSSCKSVVIFRERFFRLSLRSWFLIVSLVYVALQGSVFFYFRRMSSTDLIHSRDSPHITFGIIADVQYADSDDGTDYSKTRQRFYRNSLNLLKNAINDWKRSADPVGFVVQLGDLIDGKNRNEGEASSLKALNLALQPLESLHVPIYHVLGNHELYNMNRSFYLSSPLNSSMSYTLDTASDRFYYTKLPHPKLRIVALDTYEVSLLGYHDQPEDIHYKTAQALIRQNNKNEDVNNVSGLDGLDRRWAAYNGGVSNKQLAWLSSILMKAQAKEENVIIITHVAVKSQYRDYAVCLAWNYEAILDVIRQYQCVIAVFAGHEHAGWDHVDDHGIQYITFQGIIETQPESNAYATARLWNKSIAITGVGRVPSLTIPLRYHV